MDVDLACRPTGHPVSREERQFIDDGSQRGTNVVREDARKTSLERTLFNALAALEALFCGLDIFPQYLTIASAAMMGKGVVLFFTISMPVSSKV